MNAQILREDVEGVDGAFKLYNLLSREECEELIEETEKRGYNDRTHPNYQNTYIDSKEMQNRTNTRHVWEMDKEFCSKISQKIYPFVPKTIQLGERTWNVCDEFNCFNNMCRFYKYEAEQMFGMHKDNAYTRGNGERSNLSFLIYLNDDFEGGETTFFKWVESTQEFADIPVSPVQGMALAFHHAGKLSPFHEGSKHTTPGKVKY
eukprot:CAMPEP_0174264826 /NCGR_PEP_ID=MMETSP0439-20130205/24139_1 /TAXON_ID=0 /ORGANISM="Stereomyxa ramosa, Strain Chinc5" /LENGTH=204 /DNA_ID=CAMNT_0015350945 /DNA_START=76 /DNA_END=687 /DNA_ORIENTATION=+